MHNIFSPNKTLAIVGNSPCEKGKKHGALIDSHDYVARFNNFSVAQEYHEDYGKKANVWVSVFWCDIVYPPPEMKFDAVFCPMPMAEKRWEEHFGSVDFDKLHAYKARLMPSRYYNELLRLINCPSSGIAFLYWVYKEKGRLQHEDIFGFGGFSKAMKHHYCDDRVKAGNHDGVTERKLIDEICKDVYE